MFGLNKYNIDDDNLMLNLADAFRETDCKVSKKKTRGPVMGDGFRDGYIEINWGSKFYYVMIHAKGDVKEKRIQIITKATYHKDYAFNSCPFFYKRFKYTKDSISSKSVNDDASLWQWCMGYAENIIPSLKRDFEVFKEEVNKTIMEYPVKDDGSFRGISCMIDANNKKEVLMDEIFDESSRDRFYDLTGNDYFLSSEVKELFVF